MGIRDRFKDIRVAYGKARVAKDKILMDSVVATEAYKASAVADSLFFATVDATYYKLVMDTKDSYWGPLMMISLFSYLTEEQKSWYDALSEAVSYTHLDVYKRQHSDGELHLCRYNRHDLLRAYLPRCRRLCHLLLSLIHI